MSTTTTVRFRSTRFQPLRPEEDQVNPGVYGEELARWLSGRLIESASIQPRVDYEDFAWLVEIPLGGGKAWLFCANEFGSDDLWMIDVRRAPRLLGWLRRSRPRPDAIFDLCTRLHAILSAAAGISEIAWLETGKAGEQVDVSETPHR